MKGFFVVKTKASCYTNYVKKEKKLSKSFKFFNVLQIIIFMILTLGALLSMLYNIVTTFEITALYGIVETISGVAPFVFVGFGQLSGLFLLQLIGEIGVYVYLAISVLIFVGLLILTIRLFKPAKYYQKIRALSLITTIFLAIFMGFNAYMVFSGLGFSSIVGILAFVMSALFVVMFIYHLIMNIVGKKQLNNSVPPVDPNTFFGGPQGGPPQNYGFAAPQHSQAHHPAPPVHPAAPPAPPRRMPPPPPPRRPQ